MKLPQPLQKAAQLLTLTTAGVLSSAANNDAQAQQFSTPTRTYNRTQQISPYRNEIYGRGINLGPGINGAAGSNIASNFWAPEFNRQIQNPTRNNFGTYNNGFNQFGNGLNSYNNNFNQFGNRYNSNNYNYNRSQGQSFSRPQGNYSSNTQRQSQTQTTEPASDPNRHNDKLEQIKNAKTSPDGTFKYVLNINDSRFHLIIPISKDFQLPEMKEMYRVEFKDPFKAGTPYYYLVTNDSIEASYQEQQSNTNTQAQSSTDIACRKTTSCLKRICCPNK